MEQFPKNFVDNWFARTRDVGISTLKTSREKHIKWAETTNQPHDEDTLARVDLLDKPVEDIVAAIKQQFSLEEPKAQVQQPVVTSTETQLVEDVIESASVPENVSKKKNCKEKKLSS
jgi:hypothetical protein